jgi:integrase
MPGDELQWQALDRSLRNARKRKAETTTLTRHHAHMAKRSYGSGCLFVRGGNWYGRWWIGDLRIKRVLGPVRSPGSRDGLTRSQAERELRRRMESELPSISRHDRPSIADAGRRYVDHLEHVMERKPSTIQDYRGYLSRHLEPYFGDQPTDRIDADQVTGYLKAKRADGLAPKTVQNHLNFLHGIFAFAAKRGWTSTNPVARVDRPRGSRTKSRRLRFLQPEELDAVIRAASDDALGAVERPLYLCAAMTGMRQGELLAVRWVDIDWAARRIRVADNFTRGQFGTPKSDHGRSIPMADRLAGELERHFQRSHFQDDNDLVFYHPETGNVLDPSKLRKRFATSVSRAQVHAITFHELRHTFGTQMAAAGAPLRAIQEWMGHADAKTTEIYSHYAPDPTGGAAFAERAFGGGRAPRRAGITDDVSDAALPPAG